MMVVHHGDGRGRHRQDQHLPMHGVLSFNAVVALRAKGYKVRRLEDGFPQWKAAGLAVEAG